MCVSDEGSQGGRRHSSWGGGKRALESSGKLSGMTRAHGGNLDIDHRAGPSEGPWI